MTTFLFETLTPLHIGNGEILSPYGDYIYDPNKKTVYLVDPNKLSRVLNDPERNLMDEYVDKILSSSSTKHYTLKRFLDDYQINYQEIVKTEIKVKEHLKSEQIFETIKSGTRPYVPGSSIKGALRTGVLYTHRKEDGYTIQDALYDIGGGKKGGRQPGPNGEDLFGRFGNDLFKYLYISDTELLDENEIEIVKTYRVNLVKEEADIPIVKEVIPANKKLRFRIQSKSQKDYDNIDDRFAYFYESKDLSGEREILRRVNEFTIDLLKAELEIFRKNQGLQFALIIHQYEQILATAQQFVRKQNGCVLRLGSGKTYFDNTVTRLFTDEEIEKLPLNRKGKGLFPRTRTVISNQGIYESVLGWAKIQLVEE